MKFDNNFRLHVHFENPENWYQVSIVVFLKGRKHGTVFRSDKRKLFHVNDGGPVPVHHRRIMRLIQKTGIVATTSGTSISGRGSYTTSIGYDLPFNHVDLKKLGIKKI